MKSEESAPFSREVRHIGMARRLHDSLSKFANEKILSRTLDHKKTYMATKKLKTAKKLQKTKPLMSVRNLRKPV
jgi:hypothetical protein